MFLLMMETGKLTTTYQLIRAVGNEMIFAALVFCFSIFVKRIYTSIEIAAKFKVMVIANCDLFQNPP